MEHQIIIDILTALIPIVITIFGYLINKYIKTPANLAALEKLVDAAVVFAEKEGAIQKLTGSQQFRVALNYVQDMINKLGITPQDEKLLKGLIEQSWAKQKATLGAVYHSGQEQADADSLAAQQKQIDEAKAQLAKDRSELSQQEAQLQKAVSMIKQSAVKTSQPTQPSQPSQPSQANKATQPQSSSAQESKPAVNNGTAQPTSQAQ